MTQRFSILLMTAAVAVMGFACADGETTTATTEPAASDQETKAPTGPVILADGYATPESVLYDADNDLYYVSHINGQPLEADDNGYITRLPAEDLHGDGKWIDGTTDEVELHAPKGLAIVGDELWVTDIDQIRRFDRTTGQARGSIAIEGATFLNDLATGPDGTIYVSDSGMKAGAGGFEPSGSDAVHRVTPQGETEVIAEGSELNAPNGLLVTGGDLWVVTFGSNELYRLVEGRKTDVVTLPTGGLDGIGQAPDGDLLISSWEGSTIYKGPPSGPFEPLVQGVTSPADIGIDSKRNLLLIPVFQEDRVEIHPLASSGPEDQREP